MSSVTVIGAGVDDYGLENYHATSRTTARGGTAAVVNNTDGPSVGEWAAEYDVDPVNQPGVTAIEYYVRQVFGQFDTSAVPPGAASVRLFYNTSTFPTDPRQLYASTYDWVTTGTAAQRWLTVSELQALPITLTGTPQASANAPLRLFGADTIPRQAAWKYALYARDQRLNTATISTNGIVGVISSRSATPSLRPRLTFDYSGDPYLVGVAPLAASVSGLSFSLAAVPEILAGDLIILVAETASQAIATPTGYQPLTPVETGSAGGTTSTRLSLFTRIATGGETGVTFADPGDHIAVAAIVIRGADPDQPIEQYTTKTNANSSAPTSPALAAPGGTKRLVLFFKTLATDATSNNTTLPAAPSGVTGFEELIDAATNVGNGGVIHVAAGFMETPQAIPALVFANTNAAVAALAALYVRPPPQLISGTLSGTFAPMTGTGAGKLKIRAQSALTFAPLQGTGAGKLTIRGTGGGQFQPLAGTGVGKLILTASLSVTFQPLTGTGAGTLPIRAQLVGSFPPLIATGTIEQATPPLISGVGNATFEPLAGTGSAKLTVTALAALTFAPLQGVGTSQLTITARGTAAFMPLISLGTASLAIEATGAGEFAPLSVAAFGKRPFVMPIGRIAYGVGGLKAERVASANGGLKLTGRTA